MRYRGSVCSDCRVWENCSRSSIPIYFKYFDPATFHVEWEVALPKSASIPSLYGLSDNALIYLDEAMASIDKVTPEGATVMHQALHGVRILSIDSR